MKTAKELYDDPRYPDDYSVILNSFGQVLVKVDSEGYTGDSRVLLFGEESKQYGYLFFGWGSCSGCDALQSCTTYEEIDDLIHELYQKIEWFDNEFHAIIWLAGRDWAGCEPGETWEEDFKSKAIRAIIDRESEQKEKMACLLNPITPPPNTCSTHCGCVSTGHGVANAGPDEHPTPPISNPGYRAAQEVLNNLYREWFPPYQRDFKDPVGECTGRVTIGPNPPDIEPFRTVPWHGQTCETCGWFYQYDEHDLDTGGGVCECRMSKIELPDVGTRACPAYEARQEGE